MIFVVKSGIKRDRFDTIGLLTELMGNYTQMLAILIQILTATPQTV